MDYNSSVIVLGYVLSPEKDALLMIFHNADVEHDSYGKYNGYSDAIRGNESAAEAFQRCVAVQAGVRVTDMRFRGSIHWPGFRQPGKSVFAQIFVADRFEGDIREQCRLGANRWVTIDELRRGDVPTWPGDRHFLPLILDADPRPFHGHMPYSQGTPKDWFFQRC